MAAFIYPPRPVGKMNPSDLSFYEQSGRWVAQRKFNGCRNLVHIKPNGNIEAFTRDGEKQSTFSNVHCQEILKNLRLVRGVEYWLDSEIMSKTPNSAKEVVFYDVLQVDKYLFGGPKLLKRLDMLAEICGLPNTYAEDKLAFQISEHLWLAETFHNNFVAHFNESLTNPKIEGLVLKKIDSVLDHYGQKYYETNWLVRCRKPFSATKGYNF
jgi:ATP-dependent DNA ligase